MTDAAKPLGGNPKDLHGYKKVDMSLVSPISVAHEAHAMMDGARKYGPYNWRGNAVLARVYIAAAIRHIEKYAAGEQSATDSGVHHLGHAKACLGIILDAEATGNLIDDRAHSPELIAVLDAIDMQVLQAAEKRAADAKSKEKA